MNRSVLPGATVGMLGSGQLGRMFAIAARRFGYRVHVFSPEQQTPAGQVADVEVCAAYEDVDAIAAFAKEVDVVSFEFENVLFETVAAVERHAPVFPAGEVLFTTQHRLREKTFLQSIGVPVTPFYPIRSLADLTSLSDADFPGVLKTAASGYDGKGQVKLHSRNDAPTAWSALQTDEAILERFVDFELELSIVAARGQNGDFIHYGPIVNTHQNHILDLSVAPYHLPAGVSESAIEIARTILTELDVVGVLCVEFFLTKEGRLLVNELAPRPHNSGHLTMDAHVTCQFEQQVRAVCGLPLGSATQLRPAAMVNLLGDLWDQAPQGKPNWGQAMGLPGIKLHLYGKREARPGRKMGHITVAADSPAAAAEQALKARSLLTHRE